MWSKKNIRQISNYMCVLGREDAPLSCSKPLVVRVMYIALPYKRACVFSAGCCVGAAQNRAMQLPYRCMYDVRLPCLRWQH